MTSNMQSRTIRRLAIGAAIALVPGTLFAGAVLHPSAAAAYYQAASQADDSGGGGTPTTVTLTTAVSDWPIIPDPGPAAYVRYTLSARNRNGTPAANAVVRLSNAKPGVTFHTNLQGILTLVEPVNLQPGDTGGTTSITANVTATTGATASATQHLYTATMQVICSYDGRPGPDLSLLDELLPASLGAIQTLIENLGPWLSGLHTDAAGFRITVPKSRDIYAQTLRITHRGSTVFSGTGYSRRTILKVPTLLEGLQTGCTAGGLA
jgi:hypothetical protein